MKISVIIPTCNRTELLSKCLENLTPRNQSLRSQDYEIIVTDDGTENTSKEMLQKDFPWIRWIEGPKKGPASNRNRAARAANGDWLAFTDDDCLPDPCWLEEFSDALKNFPETLIFEGKTYHERPRRSFAECAPINEKGGLFPSCNFLIKKDLFNELNGFDEDYPFSFEDMDFRYRIERANHKIVFLNKATVCHPWRTVGKPEADNFFRGQLTGIKSFIMKHPEVLKSFNSKHFLMVSVVSLYSDLIPGLIHYRGRGAYYALKNMCFKLNMIVLLLPATLRYYKKKKPTIN